MSYPPITSRSDLLKAIGEATAVGAIGEAALMRALYKGLISHWQMLPGSSVGEFKRYSAACADRPTVVSIPADDYSMRGPEAFPAAERAISWARSILVHGAAATSEQYEGVIAAAKIGKRALVIECCSASLPAWLSLVSRAGRRAGVVVIAPPPGASHPIAPRVH